MRRMRLLPAALAACLVVLMPISQRVLAGTTVTVGDPNNPGALNSAINSAYSGGASTINITPGTYTIPAAESLIVQNWQNGTINCAGSTFVITNNPGTNQDFWGIYNCTNVVLEGGTYTLNFMTMAQNRITSLGPKDGKGYQTYNVTPDAGYPAPPTGTNIACDVVDGTTQQYEPQTGDFYGTTVAAQGSGTYNIDFNQSCKPLAVGDWIVMRGSWGPYKFHLYGCKNCTVQNVTLYRNGFSTIREDQCSGDTYNNCIWAPGPPPAGGTQAPLFSCAADGSDALNDTVGPTYENCQWQGLLNDDDIAIHGTFWPVNAVSGNTVTIPDSANPLLQVGQPLRFVGQSTNFYAQGKITAINNNGTNSIVTLDANYNIPLPAQVMNPDDCGAGYKIINCILGSTRSRGIIAKADGGLIQGNMIYNSGYTAIRLGEENPSSEAGYVSNVTVRNNIIVGNGAFDGGGTAIQIGMPGVEGNFNITIDHNVISNASGVSISINGANGVQVSNNTFANTSQVSYGDEHDLWVQTSSNVTLTNNLLTNPGPYAASPFWEVDASSTGINGLNASGLAAVVSPGEYLALTNAAAGLNLDDPSWSSSEGTLVQLWPSDKATAQNWQVNWQPDGSCTLTNQGGGLVLDDKAFGGQGTLQQIWPADGLTAQEWWFIPVSPGMYTITSAVNGLNLDDPSSSTVQGTHLQLWPSNGFAAQEWRLTPM